MNAKHLTKRVTELEPGYYTADSDTDGYGSLQAALALGAAHFVGEEYLKGGVKSLAIFVPPTTARNPDDGFTTEHVKIGESYYSRALREYDPPLLMWWREVIQNSVDAGAKHNAPQRRSTTIDAKIEELPDGTQRVTVTDNSGGMTLDTLRNKFMTISETGKSGDTGSAGGFGIAKELILFPWLSYEVHTRDILMRGVKGEWGTKKTEHLDGTRVTVHLPADRKTSAADAFTVVERSYLPEFTFRLNGERVRADLTFADDDQVRHFDGKGPSGVERVKLYHKPRARKQKGFFVRKIVCQPSGEQCGALFMYEKSVNNEAATGVFCCDILGSSLDTLVANRMEMLSPYRWRVEAYLRALVEDKHNATRKKKNALHKKWIGGGKMRPKAEAAGELEALMQQFVGASAKFNEATNVEKIRELLNQNAKKRSEEAEAEKAKPETNIDGPESGESTDVEDEDGGEEEAAPPTYTTPADFVDVLKEIRAVESGRADAVATTIKHLAWEQDFYVHNELEEFRVSKKLLPTDDHGNPTMIPTARKISRFWGEVCRAILIAADKPFRPYGIGWMFDTEFRGGEYRTTEGEYVSENDGEWLLLNPFRGGLVTEGKLFSLRNDADLEWIFAIATHECAHLIYRNGGHDEGYARTFTELQAKALSVGKKLRAIRDMVVKRPPGWKPKPKAPKKVKFVPEVEKKLREAEKQFKRYGYERFYVPGHGDWNSREVKLEANQGSYTGWKGELTIGGVIVFETEAQPRDVAIEKLLVAYRPFLAERFPILVAKSVDELSEAAKTFLVGFKAELLANMSYDGSADVARYTPGRDKRVYIKVWHEYADKWRLRMTHSYDTMLDDVEFKSPNPGDDDRNKEKAIDVVWKKILPALSAKLAEEESNS